MSNLFIEVIDYNWLEVLVDGEKKSKIEIRRPKHNGKAISYVFHSLPKSEYNFNLNDFLKGWEEKKGLDSLVFHSNLFGFNYKKLKEDVKENELQILAVLDVLYDRCMREGSIDKYLISVGLNRDKK